MKKVSKALCLILTTAVVLSLGVFSSSAALSPMSYGDVNLDYEVDITDATFIQKYLVGAVEFDTELPKLQKELADIDHDGRVTVKDATFIQKVLAGIIDLNFYEDSIAIDTHLTGLYMDYDSGKAMAGEAVTFTVMGHAGYNPSQAYTTSFFVNDELIFDGLEDKSWKYTFDKAGTYQLKAEIESLYGMTSSWTLTYEVIEPYTIDKLTLTAIMPDDFYPSSYGEFGLVAYAKGGVAPYEYSFAMVDYENNLILKQEFSPENIFHIPHGTGEYMTAYTVWVSVKDSEGKSYNEEYTLELGEPRPPA